MKTAFISYKDREVLLEGFVATPDEERKPLVILCHAWRGRDEFICERAELVASWGYTAFALDMYGKGVLGHSKEENAALKKPFISDRAYLRRRLLCGYQAACALPYADTSKIFVLGLGFGAVCALDLAQSGVPLNGAISIYGHFESVQGVPLHPITAKILILHGALDSISPQTELTRFQAELNAAHVDWQTHLFGTAMHAFATPTANDPSAGILYDPLSAQRSWQSIQDFLCL